MRRNSITRPIETIPEKRQTRFQSHLETISADSQDDAPFTPVDPFEPSIAKSVRNLRSSDSKSEIRAIDTRPHLRRNQSNRQSIGSFASGRPRPSAMRGAATATHRRSYSSATVDPTFDGQSSRHTRDRVSFHNDHSTHHSERRINDQSSWHSASSFDKLAREEDQGILVYEQMPPLQEVVTHDTQRTSMARPDTNAKIPAADYIVAFLVDTLPRQVYLYILLRLPALYFSRVSRIFDEAEISLPQIKQGIVDAAEQPTEPHSASVTAYFDPPTSAFGTLEKTWLLFIDSLLREWKTLNIISVLLLS